LGNADPILGIAFGTVWVEVTVDENAKVENVTTRRGIEGLTPHVARWVRTWTWKAAELDGSAMSSVVTVAVTVNPGGISTSPPLPHWKEPTGEAQSPSQFLPPQIISVAFPIYPNNNILSDAAALDVTISEMGEPVRVTVLRDVPPLTAAAIDSLKSWKFAPASLDGKPVAAQVTLAFVYRSPFVYRSSAANFPLGR
jgi:hypothetical protein